MNKEITKTSDILINIGLNPNKLPVSIKWIAEDKTPKPQNPFAMDLNIIVVLFLKMAAKPSKSCAKERKVVV